MRNKVLNSVLVIAVAAMLVVLGFYARVGATADAVVVLRTSGMTCSSCVEKITRALQSEKGVAATEVDLASGFVIAGYDSARVAPKRLAELVTATGFGSSVTKVMTPEEFRSMVGRDIGAGSRGGCGGCGPGGCGMSPAGPGKGNYVGM